MFFKRLSRSAGTQAAANDVADATAREVPAAAPAPAAREAPAEVDAGTLGFATTADIGDEPAGVPWQGDALSALAFGIGLSAPGFHVLLAGPRGTGKTTAARRLVAEAAASRDPAPDWVYVANFEDPARPQAMKLPPGRARPFAKAVAAAVDELRAALPAAFAADDTTHRRRAIEDEVRNKREEALSSLIHKAAAQNVAVLSTPTGYALAPMLEGKVVKPDVFNQLPEPMRQEVEARVTALQGLLAGVLAEAPLAERKGRQRITALEREVAAREIAAALAPLRHDMADAPDALRHLDRTEADMALNAGLFLAAAKDRPASLPVDAARDHGLRRYLVNVIVAHHGTKGAPVCETAVTTPSGLAGRVVHDAGRSPDALDIRAGDLHRANGGTLIVDASGNGASSAGLASLMSALDRGVIHVDAGTSSLEPEPIPLDVKVILIADEIAAAGIVREHPGFTRQFGVESRFAASLARSPENDRAFARLAGTMARDLALKPVEAAAVARLIEDCERQAEGRERLSLDLHRLAAVLREADHWSGIAGRTTTAREDIVRALDERGKRTACSAKATP